MGKGCPKRGTLPPSASTPLSFVWWGGETRVSRGNKAAGTAGGKHFGEGLGGGLFLNRRGWEGGRGLIQAGLWVRENTEGHLCHPQPSALSPPPAGGGTLLQGAHSEQPTRLQKKIFAQGFKAPPVPSSSRRGREAAPIQWGGGNLELDAPTREGSPQDPTKSFPPPEWWGCSFLTLNLSVKLWMAHKGIKVGRGRVTGPPKFRFCSQTSQSSEGTCKQLLYL